MNTSAPVQNTGIYPNLETQCFEAWIVDERARVRVLVSTCSMSVPEDQYKWWQHQVWHSWMPEWGVSRTIVSGRC